MPDEKKVGQEGSVEKKRCTEVAQETPEILKNLQDTIKFYFKDDKEQ